MTKNNEKIIKPCTICGTMECYEDGENGGCDLAKYVIAKEQECEELKKQLEEESKLGHKAIQEEADTFFDLLKVQKELDQLKKENEELKKKLEQEKDLNKEMRVLYEKFNGNSLIEYSAKRKLMR